MIVPSHKYSTFEFSSFGCNSSSSVIIAVMPFSLILGLSCDSSFIDRSSPNFMTTSEENVATTMGEFGWNNDKLIFGDCYSWKFGEASSKYSASLENPTGLGIMLSSMIDQEGMNNNRGSRLVLDSFSDIVMKLGEERSIKLLAQLKPRMSENGITALVTVEEGLHPKELNSKVEYLCDGTIMMRHTEKGRELMVSRMIQTPAERRWHPYSIRQGIEMKLSNFFR